MKKISYFFVFVFLAATASAANVCVVVDYNNGNVKSECVDISEDSNGYDTLEATSFNIEWSDESLWGHALCKIDNIGNDVQGTGCEWTDNYWSFNQIIDREWKHLPIGFDAGTECWNGDMSSWDGHYCAKDNDVLGLVFGSGSKLPNLIGIDNVEVSVDGDKKSGANEDGGAIKDVEPGSNIKLEIEIKNLYDKDSDITLESVTAIGTIYKIDDGDDVEDESDEKDIDAGRTKTINLELEVPLEVEDKEFDFDLVIKAEDSIGVAYEKIIHYTVDVKKEKHDVRISRAELTSPVLKCSRTTNLNVNVVNMGSEEEDVVLKIINTELELIKQLSFELDNDPFDDDSKYNTKFTITIDEEQEAGVYPLMIRVDYSSKTTENIVELELEDCEENIEETKTNVQQNIISEKPQTETSQIKASKEEITATARKSNDSFDKNYLAILVMLGVVVVVLLGSALIIKFAR